MSIISSEAEVMSNHGLVKPKSDADSVRVHLSSESWRGSTLSFLCLKGKKERQKIRIEEDFSIPFNPNIPHRGARMHQNMIHGVGPDHILDRDPIDFFRVAP